MNGESSRNGEALIAALDAAQRCQCCPDQGWYERQNTRTGPEQEQCEFCYTVEDSRFNVLERVKEFLRASRSETADIVNHAEVIGNVTAALLDLNVTYDGNRATFTFESTNNAMSYIQKARHIVEERLELIRGLRERV